MYSSGIYDFKSSYRRERQVDSPVPRPEDS